MSLVVELRVLSQKMADDAQARLAMLKSELAEIERRKAQIQTEMALKSASFERACTFRPEIDGKVQCPRCWVDTELRTALTSSPGRARDDHFRCRACQFEHSF